MSDSGKAIVSIIVIGPILILKGWALQLTWGWFVSPQFGLPAITLVQAIGISIVMSVLTHQMPDMKDELERPFADKLIRAFLIYPLVVLVAWIVKTGWL